MLKSTKVSIQILPDEDSMRVYRDNPNSHGEDGWEDNQQGNFYLWEATDEDGDLVHTVPGFKDKPAAWNDFAAWAIENL